MEKTLTFEVCVLTEYGAFRRYTVSGSRRIVTVGVFAIDSLEEDIKEAAGRAYRELVHPIVVEEGDDEPGRAA